MKRQLFFFILLFLGKIVFAQPANLSVSSIPDELRRNAHGVVRYSSTEFNYQSATSGIERHTVYITVFDRRGSHLADFYFSGDNFRRLTRFSGALYDSNGRQIRRIRQSDLRSTEFSYNLADDSKHYFFSCESPTYPFTVRYTYEVRWRKGISFLPTFIPQTRHNLSVEKAIYHLNIPENLRILSQALNFSETPNETVTNRGRTRSEWRIENLPAVEAEPMSPPLHEQIPILYLSPENIVFDGVSGTITDWNSFGLWIYGLFEGRDRLPEASRTKILELTEDAENDREKVRILYDYLGATTRYVSIQLGIGGYQPMPAAEVFRTGFGDCKGLTFYLRSMLAVVGIPSNFVVIRSDERNKTLMHNLPNFVEMNHAILQVPLQNDTLWLESTNPNLPFGFIHNGISGNDALEITKNGGRLVRLPDYPDSLNVDKNSAVVRLFPDGRAEVTAQKERHVKLYDVSFVRLRPMEQMDRMRRTISLPNVTMNNVQVTEDRSPLPSLTINYEWTTPAYGTRTGNRLFIPVNPLRTSITWFQAANRTHDIQIDLGFYYSDSIQVIIPEGFEVESLPTSIVEKSPFGKFQSHITFVENKILIKQSFFCNSGRYSAEYYESIRRFFERVNSGYSQKITLRRK